MNTIHDNERRDADPIDELDKVEQAYRQLEQTGPPDLVDMAEIGRAHV